ncbi:MAG: hypothetical protein AAGA78_12885, partial [Pseudomonadota bacterium]
MPFDLDPLPKLSKRVWCLGHLGLNGSTAAQYTEGFAALTQIAGWQLRTPTLQQALAHVPQDDPVLIHLSLVDQIPKPALRRAWQLGWQAGAAPKTVLVRVPKTWRRPGQILCLLAASLRCLTKPMSLRCVSQHAGPRRAFKHLSGLRLSRPKGSEGRAALLRHL